MPDKKPKKSWQYELPSPFFDGPNEEISRMQGWAKISSRDVVSSKVRIMNFEAVGSSRAGEKWATERNFTNEYSDICVSALDVFDQGIVMMTWWREGRENEGYGFALKISGTWRILQKGEEVYDSYEHTEINGIVKVTKIKMEIYGNRSKSLNQLVVERKD